jgi:PIN domain nuclease of toxin-antitoxin system
MNRSLLLSAPQGNDYLNEHHLLKYAEMNIPVKEHNDPNDHVIIAQAISDKIPLISSDNKFKC